MQHIYGSGARRRVETENAVEPEFGYEITYFRKPELIRFYYRLSAGRRLRR